MRPVRILVVDDEPAVREAIERALHLDGYEVELAGDGAEALQAVEARAPDAMVLDVLMPRVDGLTLTAQIRQESPVPIILLSAKGEAGDRVIGLRFGADDYIPKPFDPDELVERVRTVLRRAKGGADSAAAPAPGAAGDDVMHFGDLTIDQQSQEVWLSGDRLTVTPTEFRLLACLTRNADRTVPRQQLLEEVWGLSKSAETRTVDMHVWRLREKLPGTAPNSPIIETVRGFGYRLRLASGNLSATASN